jgi:hypothetical protein
MRIHPGRAVAATIALAEGGGLVGALLAWLYLVGRTLLWEGPFDMNGLLGAGLWAILVGLPLGALAVPLLGLTILRRTPLKRALGLPAAGALSGLVAGAALHRGTALPVPVLTMVLLGVGTLLGAIVARASTSADNPRQPVAVEPRAT